MAQDLKYQIGSHAAAMSNGERLLASKPALALVQARALLDENPNDRQAIGLLARAHDKLGQFELARNAREVAMRIVRRLPDVNSAFAALDAGRPDEVLALLAAHLTREPEEPLALLLAGEALMRLGRMTEATERLETAVAVAPGIAEVHVALARAHYNRFRPDCALAALSTGGQGNPDAAGFRAALLGEVGDYTAASQAWGELARDRPDEGAIHLNSGDAFRILGEVDAAVAAYRRALACSKPALQAWWSLASVAAERMTDEELSSLAALADKVDDPNTQVHLNFALGTALDFRGEHGPAYSRFAAGNALQSRLLAWDGRAFARRQQQIATHCGPAFIAARKEWGSAEATPIFIVGMARSGSTLLAQALGQHPAIENCGETPALAAVMLDAARARGFDIELQAVEFLHSLTAHDCLELGEAYLQRMAVRRRTAKPFFIDKLPHNWAELAFIRLILPQASFIDIKRNPIDCCLSNFVLLFSPGHPSSYGIDEWISYYSTYISFMNAMGEGVIVLGYEALVEGFEDQLLKTLQKIGLEWDTACMQFHTDPGPVATASAEQVRRPLYRDGMGSWRRFEPWLGDALPKLLALDIVVPGASSVIN